MTDDSLLPAPALPRRNRWPLAILVSAAFALGAIAVIWAGPAIERWRKPAPQPIIVTPSAAVPSAAAAAAPITIEGLAAREAALDMQLRNIEARIGTADAAARTAAANAQRAERLLIAFAVRRRLDRGQPLEGYAPLLRTRFGGEAGEAVATVIAAGRAPVTLEDLREALDTIAPRLTSGTIEDGVGRAVWREVTGLIVLRHETTPSPRPTDRLARARRMLDAGQVEGARAEVSRMPGAPAARSWIEAAQRYIAARNALSALEFVALGQPAAAAPSNPPPAPAD
ncbi:hypothetical protein [Sphingomonas sp.]|uniref:hypothetical protein n=1 Tax=Sphingomonas sp. TaxID=28214 RepID=UPI002CB8F11D|nr:hypothetical protein [Sphingomonas sp.]HWK37193.1 hypothetical protein [Sphingomonas sp.]